eukprot:TRINITY_DN63171_c0_g1_i1.p1 TRINITY_DN63171_c0_g1~~TRINITY_DN63171_c0_g1_i1.p1  ORF type:complete len:295 (-),score=31.51 TRINITY_DN63171_c0_g1_i1:397-1281(-)
MATVFVELNGERRGFDVFAARARKLCAHVAVGAASSSCAGVITNPIDVVKTEMQMSQGSLGMIGTLRSRVAAKGVTSLWAGVFAMFLRSVFYAGIRLGAYDPIKDALGAKQNPTMWRKILAGTISGSLGAVAANPIEVVKTRVQADPNSNPSTSSAIVNLVTKEGLRGLSKGLFPHVLRGAAVTSSQIGVYDDTKHRLGACFGLRDGILLRLCASMVAGIVTTTVSNPCDVIKTRVMVRKGGSVLGVSRELLAQEGPRGFLKGWVANYSRLGPHTVIVFMVYEQIRYLAGLGTI